MQHVHFQGITEQYILCNGQASATKKVNNLFKQEVLFTFSRLYRDGDGTQENEPNNVAFFVNRRM